MASIDDVVKQAKKAKRKSRNKKSAAEINSDKVTDISYSKTRIINVDNEILTNNRVIAQNKEDPRSTPFHMLRTKVLRELRDNDWNSIAISAPTPGAGKSLVTVNLAMSIAMETNQTVLIVDMDLRKPSIHKYFSFEPEYGLQDFIDGNASVEDIMINPGIDRLVIMPGRKRVLNSSEQLSSPMLRTLTEELKNKYESRVILYDLPPLLVSDDVMAFLPNVDSSLLVIESGQNTKEEIEASIAMLEQKPLLGTILNKELKAPKLYIY
ncbi:CpsD/CapB family tyrosine-protein kinase [Amphritea sp.]|uniref:CpsD/CapB family tyrosine-protein kinase n=1 Tax=Amphritea sp. TaxID=1872502 RepID=UPI0025BD9A50|nr:CpsD/CapB family tyrosine-protein kinase [Amphritea sp.]